jgi:hypothetical protein
MSRLKLLTVLVGMIATVALSATPAFATFQSKTGSSKGTVKTGAVVLTGGGATLECTSSSGTWTILSGGVPATTGKNEQLAFTTFTGCTAKSSLLKGAAAVVKACTLELEQNQGENKAIGSTVANCTVEVKAIGTCTITVEGGQTGLKENTLVNSGANDIITANDSGIKSKPSAACLGIKETKEATQKAVATAEGQNWV